MFEVSSASHDHGDLILGKEFLSLQVLELGNTRLEIVPDFFSHIEIVKSWKFRAMRWCAYSKETSVEVAPKKEES